MWQRFDPPSAPSTLWDTLRCSPRQMMAVVAWAVVLLLVAPTAERRVGEAVDAITAPVSTWRVPYFADGPRLMPADDETAACGSGR